MPFVSLKTSSVLTLCAAVYAAGCSSSPIGPGPTSSVSNGISAGGSAPAITGIGTDEEWRALFFWALSAKGVGPLASPEGLAAVEPELVARGTLLQKDSAGELRGRIYLPTGNPDDPWSRAVDIGDFGGPWQWVVR